jgi:hypothetical protein
MAVNSFFPVFQAACDGADEGRAAAGENGEEVKSVP